MPSPSKPKSRRRGVFLRRTSLFLMRLGITSEMVAIFGMILGILAGTAFMATGETEHPRIGWGIGGALCLLRVIAIRLDGLLQSASERQSRDEEFYNELPERVSDAVTLLGFGFAAGSDPWLGLGAALAAIFSAYIRSLVTSRAKAGQTMRFVPMRRNQRLVLLALVSGLMIDDQPYRYENYELPQMALVLVIVGCLSAVCLRWFHLRAIKV